jgi:prophage tail gpP-like protein
MAVNPNEVASIVTSAGVYSYWKSIEIERAVGNPVSYMRFTTAEPGIGAGQPPSWNTLQLMPPTPIQGYLAGQIAITGAIMSRQAAYEANNHAVEIICSSKTQNGIGSTVDGAPGQYLNQTIAQIAGSVYGKVGVAVNVDGASGASYPFERVSEQIGEPRNDFIRRLAMMRDLHMVDDSSGNLNLVRGETAASANTTLVEGQNIFKARILVNLEYANTLVNALGQDFGTNQHNGPDAAQVSATVPNPSYTGDYRPVRFICEMPCDQTAALMRAQHEVALNDMTICEALITVQGWLMDSGDLWINHLREPVTIVSPSLVPGGPFTLLIKGVKHLQDSEQGTRTELTLCIPRALGGTRLVNPGNSVPGT